ncbi:MAG: hypothetical protein APR53_01790 [Methanoculleus sp. SDB]|nr:MAG: hypothetical protein APR53_01790 [Methanoculleus sp. SDB]
MINETAIEQELIPDIDEINRKLILLDQQIFSERAFIDFRKHVTNFILSLINESATASLRHKGDIISEADVDAANRYLTAHTKYGFFEKIDAYGGILFGAAIGALLSIDPSTSIFSPNTILILFFGLVGVILMAYGWKKSI